MTKAGKDYLLGFGLSMMIAYPLMLFLSSWLLRQYPSALWTPLVAVLPVVPVLFGLRAFLRFLNRLDEMQQKVQLNAIALAAGATAIICLTLGFLENAGLPMLSLIWVFPMMVAIWGVATAVVARRYR